MNRYSKKLIYLVIVAGFLFGPVRGKMSATGGSSADHAFQTGRTSNGINFAKGPGEGPVQSRVSVESLNLNPLDAVNKAGVGVNIDAGDVLEAFKFNFPFNLNNINIDTNTPASPKTDPSQALPDIDLRQFLTPKDISSDDLGGAIKAIAALIINIFLVVISVVTQILKLILGFLS